MPASDISALANEFMEARSQGKQVTRPSARDEAFDLSTAYSIADELTRLQVAQGHKPTGRKIGVSNRTLWGRLGIETLLWGYVYDNTVQYLQDNKATFSLANRVAPKLEPEIVFKLSAPLPEGSEDAAKVLEAVEWIALGFEIVDCHYSGWRYKAPDFVADFGFHVALIIGEPHPVSEFSGLAEQLANCKLKLFKNGEPVAEGGGKNVLENPALSLGCLAGTLAKQPGAATLAAGEVITSGTMTDAQFVAAGEEWVAELEGLALPRLTINFTA